MEIYLRRPESGRTIVEGIGEEHLGVTRPLVRTPGLGLFGGWGPRLW